MDRDLLRKFISAVALQNGMAVPQMPDFDNRPLRVIDTIYFGDLHESLALQLADVCCSTITRHLLGEPEAEPFYNIIRQQVITDNSLIRYSDGWKREAEAQVKIKEKR